MSDCPENLRVCLFYATKQPLKILGRSYFSCAFSKQNTILIKANGLALTLVSLSASLTVI